MSRICKKENCGKIVTSSTQVYCSKDCAPLGNFRGGPNLKYDSATGTFIPAARGVVLPKPSAEERRAYYDILKEKAVLHSKKNKEKRVENIMQTTEQNASPIVNPAIKSSPNGVEKNYPAHGWHVEDQINPRPIERSENGIAEINPPSSLPSFEGEEKVTQFMGYIAPLQTGLQAKSKSLNLLDDSIQHLHSLMKDLGSRADVFKTDPQTINSTCLLAKNMREMMKLKLDIIKLSRGE